MIKPYKVEFAPGCFDELEDDMTQAEFDALLDGIRQLVATGEIFENSTSIEELPEDEQQTILDMLDRKEKRKKH
jgi:Mg/Co/Ni transporter MgtE